MEKYIIKESSDRFTMEPLENGQKRIVDAWSIHTFWRTDGFETVKDVCDYVCTYFGLSTEQIIIKKTTIPNSDTKTIEQIKSEAA